MVRLSGQAFFLFQSGVYSGVEVSADRVVMRAFEDVFDLEGIDGEVVEFGGSIAVSDIMILRCADGVVAGLERGEHFVGPGGILGLSEEWSQVVSMDVLGYGEIRLIGDRGVEVLERDEVFG